ncbi:TrmH family RNA methyltransferase [Candidatus Parcubacteria bacterium]|nr:MAG: TrmH family RNA methyltransferase [Candidatus Parcubacteria bacterium]
MQIAALFHNVRSTHNVGALFRTADGAGASKIFLSGYTPTPIDRFGRERKDVSKTALGAEKTVPWEYAEEPRVIIERLKQEGWEIVGVEQDARSVDYRAFEMQKPTLFIFGNEVRGISPALRAQCDRLIEIPMRGALVRQAHHPRNSKLGKESLNVSVTAGIILFSAQDGSPERGRFNQ